MVILTYDFLTDDKLRKRKWRILYAKMLDYGLMHDALKTNALIFLSMKTNALIFLSMQVIDLGKDEINCAALLKELLNFLHLEFFLQHSSSLNQLFNWGFYHFFAFRIFSPNFSSLNQLFN